MLVAWRIGRRPARKEPPASTVRLTSSCSCRTTKALRETRPAGRGTHPTAGSTRRSSPAWQRRVLRAQVRPQRRELRGRRGAARAAGDAAFDDAARLVDLPRACPAWDSRRSAAVRDHLESRSWPRRCSTLRMRSRRDAEDRREARLDQLRAGRQPAGKQCLGKHEVDRLLVDASRARPVSGRRAAAISRARAASQWRAICSRVAIQASPRCAQVLEGSAPGAFMRPGRPIMRRCRPTRQHARRACSPSRASQSEASHTYSREARAGVEALRVLELHVVGVERVGQHQVRAGRRPSHEIRRVVVVGVAVVQEAVLHEQAPRVAASQAERVCQPTGRWPVACSIARTRRGDDAPLLVARPCRRALSQRQPCADTSWPRATASRASQGERSTARPQALSVNGAPWRANRSAMRHQPTRVPYSKWLSMHGSQPVARGR